jgi:hypothetical protein
LDNLTSEEREAFVELGFARNRRGIKDTVIDEPLAILAALHWLNQNAQFSFFDTLHHDIKKHSNRENGFEVYLAFYVRHMFEKGLRLNLAFPFRSDFAERPDLKWQYDEFQLVTVKATHDRDTPDVSVVTPSSGPSSNIAFIAETGEEVNEWLTTNIHGFTFCFPPQYFGADVLWFMRHKETGKLLLFATQAKKHETVHLATLKHGVRTVTPDWFWKSKNLKVCFYGQ